VDDGLEFALLVRLREVVAGSPATEVELRSLLERADAWVRALEAQLRAAEGRLSASLADPETPVAAFADELRRIRKLRPELDRVRSELAELTTRARQLRAGWLAGRDDVGPSGRRT
jgi:hypothetical protein